MLEGVASVGVGVAGELGLISGDGCGIGRALFLGAARPKEKMSVKNEAPPPTPKDNDITCHFLLAGQKGRTCTHYYAVISRNVLKMASGRVLF